MSTLETLHADGLSNVPVVCFESQSEGEYSFEFKVLESLKIEDDCLTDGKEFEARFLEAKQEEVLWFEFFDGSFYSAIAVLDGDMETQLVSYVKGFPEDQVSLKSIKALSHASGVPVEKFV